MRTVAQLTAAFRSRELSPVEAAQECLKAIEDRDGEVGAFVTVTPRVAVEAARASEARWRRGEPASPLDGVPVAMKDLSATSGVRTTFGSLLYRDYVPEFDVTYWARLKAGGAVLVGKTNTPEFGAMPTTENLLGPPTRNPWDLSRTAGGSSGGAAAALAAGLVPLAEGSDGAGSIRIPASCCGVVGIKPSRGRVSEGPLFGEQMGALATSGPMGLNVEDCVLMLEGMAGPDPGDPYPAASMAPAAPATRVGVAIEAPHGPLHPDVSAAVERVAAEIEGLGVSVEPVALPLEGFMEPLVTVWSVGMAAVPLADLDRVHPVVRMQVEEGRSTAAVRYERARIRLHRLGRGLRLAMSPYDAVLLPVLTTPPKPLGFVDALEAPEEIFALLPYTYPFNATGQPAVAIPAGRSTEGLPIGAQLVGRLGEDERVAALAARWEAARGLPHPMPAR